MIRRNDPLAGIEVKPVSRVAHNIDRPPMRHRMFWGILIVLIGLAIIIKAVFPIDIPLFRILFGVLLIYLGVQLLLGWPRWGRGIGDEFKFSAFGERIIRLQPGQVPEDRYSVAFGNAMYDFTKVSLESRDIDVEVSVSFGKATIQVSQATPVVMEAGVAFGSAEFPDGSQVAMGKQTYRSENANSALHSLRIRSRVAFGQILLVRQ
jgi:predicted membrane protein